MAEQLTEQIFYPGGYADNTMSVKTFDELSALPRGRKFVGLTVVVTNALGDNIPATFWLVKDKSTWVLKDMPAVDSITALNNIPSDYINLGYVAHLTNGDSYIFKGLNEEDSTQQWELTLDREEIDGIISDAVDLAVSNVTSGAPEAFDTLKEIADWIENHGNVAEGIQGDAGAQGNQGEVGAQGAQGDQGEVGAQGAQGEQGEVGAQGAQGEQGEVGAQGAQGEQGEIGAQGAQGEQGEIGAQGAQGEQGEVGAQGAQGDQGEAGTQGSQGETGAQGEKGLDGKSVNVRGSKADCSVIDSDSYVDDEYHLQILRSGSGEDGVYEDLGLFAVVGPQGNNGEQGAQGEQGEVGAQGSQGDQGEVGAQGSQGETGVQGTQGDQGEVGAQGTQGNQGEIGAQGNQGEIGAQGAQGDQGEVGDQGAQGEQGEVGAQGAQGEQGEIGAQGSQGETGAQGAQGEVGAQGAQGEVGAQGEKGDKPTDEEVKAIAVSALTEILIPENASESMDTLAEISSWIQSHPGDASKMNGDIQSLSGQVETLISNNGEENKIETIKVNGSALTVSDKSVDIEIAPAETKTTNDIIVVGGPLADDASDNWPTDADWKDADGNKKIPSGLTFEEVLVKLFSKEVWYTPTISYEWFTSVSKAPSVSISTATTGNLSGNQTVEAGTIFYFNGSTANLGSATYKVSSNGCTNGYCKDGDKSTYSSGNYSKTYTATTSGDYQLKATVTGFKSNVEGTEAFSIANVDANTAIPSSSDAMYAQEGTNKIVVAQSGLTYSPASSESFETFKLYAASNIKSYSSAYSKDVEYVYSGKTSIVAKGSTDSKVVTGIRHKFYGAKTSVLSLTSDNMRTFSHDATANTFTISVPDKAAQVVIAFPASLGKTLVSVTSAAQLGAAITSNFVKVSGGVDIEGANGYKAINYDVWQYVPSAVWNGTDTLTVTMK